MIVNWKKFSAIAATVATVISILVAAYTGYTSIKDSLALKKDVTTMMLSVQLAEASEWVRRCDLKATAGSAIVTGKLLPIYYHFL